MYASVQRDVLRCFPSFVPFKAIPRDWLVGTQYYMYRWVYVHRTPSMYTLVGLLFRNKKEQESTKARWFIFMWSPPSTPDTTSYSWNHQPTNREMRKFLLRSLSSSSASSCVWWSKEIIPSLVPCVYHQPNNHHEPSLRRPTSSYEFFYTETDCAGSFQWSTYPFSFAIMEHSFRTSYKALCLRKEAIFISRKEHLLHYFHWR